MAAPSTYHASPNKQPSKRAVRDEQLKLEILRVWDQNYRVYGADKIWAQLNREGIKVARCTIERLMRQLGVKGAVRGKRRTTTPADAAIERPRDLVERAFSAPAPNRLWLADITYVRTWDRLRLCLVRHRLLRPHDRRVAGVALAAHRPRS